MSKLRNTIAATVLLASLVGGSTQLAQASDVEPGRRVPSVPEAWSPEGRALYSVSVPEAWSLEGRAS